MTNDVVPVRRGIRGHWRHRALNLILTVAMLLAGRPAAARLSHVVLLDVSGSMKPTWADTGFRDALDRTLLGNPKVLATDEELVVRTFTTSQPPTYPDDSCRLWPHPGQRATLPTMPADREAAVRAVTDAVPLTTGDTDLYAAWQGGLAEKEKWCRNTPSVLWMLTDNWQDPSGNGDGNLDAFYHDLRNNDRVLAVVLMPLIRNPRGVQGNMVLYAILCGLPREAVEVQAEFASRTRALTVALGADAVFGKLAPVMITCKFHASGEPAIRQVSLEFQPTDPGVTTHIDGSTVVVEGLRPDKPLEGTMHFNLESRLAEWRLVGARLKPARMRFGPPEKGIVNQPNDCEHRISPPWVTFRPGNVADIRYSINATGDRALFVPEVEGSTLRRLFPGADDVIPAKMDLGVVVDVQHNLILDSDELRNAVQHVRMLDGITELLRGTTNVRQQARIQVPIRAASFAFHVDSTYRVLGVAVGIWLLLLLLLVAAGALVPAFLPQVGFLERIPGGTEQLKLTCFGKPHVVMDGQNRLGQVTARYPSGLKFMTAPKSRIVGTSKREVVPGSDPVTFTLADEASERTLRIGRGEPR